jgi:hypothetical protein
MVLKRLISTIIFLILQIPSVGYTVLGNVAESQLNVLEKQGQLLNRIPGISFEIH